MPADAEGPSHSPAPSLADAWDAEYRAGRYARESPLPFVADILAAARRYRVTRGVYVGCGNGRNYVPLCRSGLDLLGLDLSAVAIEQLVARAPELRANLRHGDLETLPASDRFPLVIGIQVFQHGTRAACHAHVRRAQARLAAGGLFCLRVNAAGTPYEYPADVVETDPDGSETVRHRSGLKAGVLVHWFARTELEDLFEGGYRPILPLRRAELSPNTLRSRRPSQWEAIWRKSSR